MDTAGNISTGAGNITDEAGHANCTYEILSAKEMFVENMSTPWSQAIIITVTVMSFLTVLIFVETACSTQRAMEYGSRRGYTLFIIGLLPVFSVTSLTGIYIPKAALVGLWAASVYLSVTLYIFLMLIINYFDGPNEMVAKLAKMTVSLAQAPLACCFPCCCRRIRLTSTNLHRLRAAVLQMAVVHPMAYFVTAILWADGLYEPSEFNHASAYLYLTVIMIVSTLTAMYALTIINVAADASLSEMYGTFRLRFSLIKFFMIVPSLQGLAVNIVSQAVAISFPCHGILSPMIRASMMYNILIIVEMFLLLLIGRCKAFCIQDHGPLHQAGRADSLDTTQSRHRYAEVRPLASPLLDAEGNGPAFPVHLLELEKASLKLRSDQNHEDILEIQAGGGAPSRMRTTMESDV